MLGVLDSANLAASVEVVISPPDVYLEYCKTLTSKIQFSAQNCHDQLSGAFTGATRLL